MKEEGKVESPAPGRPVGRRAVVAAALAAAGLPLSPARAWAAGRRRYRIVYRLGGGANPRRQVKYVAAGGSVKARRLKDPSRRGYAFRGWFSDGARTRRLKRLRGARARAGRTAYAAWEPVEYSIGYDLDGGSFRSEPPASFDVERAVELHEPSKRGYAFGGWFEDAELTRPCARIPKGSVGDRVLHARWEAVSYPISYDLGGGFMPPGYPSSYTAERAVELPAPSKPGAEFVCWCDDAALARPRAGLPAGSAGAVSLHAKWSELPAWWEGHLEERAARVNAIAAGMADGGFSFAFVTDLHYPDSAGHLGAVLRRLARLTGVARVVCGGDLVTRRDGRDAALADAARWAADLLESGMDGCYARGNHDSNAEVSPARGKDTISDEGLRALLLDGRLGQDEACGRERFPLYYHVDFAPERMRLVVLDTGQPCWDSLTMGPEQAAWLAERVEELPAGWHVAVACHRFFRFSPASAGLSELPLEPNGELILEALGGAAASARADVVGVFCGHCHRDFAIRSGAGFPCVATMNDSYLQSAYWDPSMQDRRLGDASEHALDVVQVDYAARKVHMTRIGPGPDREFGF